MYIYILDYSDVSIHEIEVESNDSEEIEEELVDKGFKLSNINWMSSDIKLEINENC